ncbi:hypothetical protein [Baaleninema simplex]|uniref:hypothetical protein n=1 Tax=Baaleninema simplex TaxID=2862350 RepID=UPI000345AE0F|nr:hypothetical protein [Baaleninema simplex]
MTDRTQLTEKARAQAREELGKDPSFRQLSKPEQFSLYKNRVGELTEQFSRQQALADAMAAGDLIDDSRHLNRRIDQQGAIAGRTLRQVDFPQFVKDLLKGVFDANLEVTKEQMDSYADLVDRITQPASKFINTIDDATAYAFLSETQPNRFQLLGADSFSGDLFSDSGDQSSQINLGDASGNPVDTTSDDIRGEVLQAKLQLVRQHQQLLEEMLLMGVTRLVVDNGKVKANIDFQIRAQEQIRKADAGQQDTQRQKIRRRSMGGFFGFFGSSRQTTKTQISVSTAQVQSAAATTSSTQVRGEVEINFKTDYFPLENFRDILMNRDNPGSVKPKTDGTQPQNGQTP